MIKKIEHIIEYGLLIIIAYTIRILPLSLSYKIAEFLAFIAFFVVGVRRKVVIDNLSKAFAQEKSLPEINKIAFACYCQFAKTMVELLCFPKWRKKDIINLVEVENIEIIERALQQKKGCVLVSGHFGNWELLGAAVCARHPLSFVIGKQENSLVDDLLNSYRAKQGFKMIPLKVALRGVMKALKANEFVAMLSDQDAHEQGAFVNFFNRPSSTPKGPAIFALRADCPMIFAGIAREKGKIKAFFEPVAKPSLSQDEESQIREYTQNYTSILEKYTRKYPDHWFWMHRRWKTKPLPEKV